MIAITIKENGRSAALGLTGPSLPQSDARAQFSVGFRGLDRTLVASTLLRT
jgi:hypothetical protein